MKHGVTQRGDTPKVDFGIAALRRGWCALWGHEDDQIVTIDEAFSLRVCSRCQRESWNGRDDEALARARRILADGKLPVARTVPR